MLKRVKLGVRFKNDNEMKIEIYRIINEYYDGYKNRNDESDTCNRKCLF